MDVKTRTRHCLHGKSEDAITLVLTQGDFQASKGGNNPLPVFPVVNSHYLNVIFMKFAGQREILNSNSQMFDLSVMSRLR